MTVLKAFGIAVALVVISFALVAFVMMRPIPWIWEWEAWARAELLIVTAYLTVIVRVIGRN